MRPKIYSTGKVRMVALLPLILFFFPNLTNAQSPSVAMQWSEVQLACIRKDAARPTIQARNLYHASIVMYDAWAVYDDDATTVLLGNTLGNYTCPFNGIIIPEDKKAAQEKAISYAMYRFLTNRYQPFSPTPVGQPQNNWITFSSGYLNTQMALLGYDPSITSTDYSDGDPAKLGNYIAQKMQEYGLQDGANQANNYANQYYFPVNGNIFAELPGNPQAYDGNRWQPLSLTTALDQNGLPVPSGAPALSAEWGNVVPFSLTPDQITQYERDGNEWNVYLDQGAPPYLDTTSVVERQWDEDFFRWGFVVVALWHSFHDTADGVMKNISPNSLGNVDDTNFPTTFEEFKAFYNEFNGGDPGTGYDINPATGQPYPDNIVPRADYSRVLAEYWADGPNSETPPGHWFKNINAIANHPLFEKRWEGQGEILDDLEWDVRAYLALGGGIHDAAVACWSTKGYYDYTRPIMAIRYMIDHGQCSDMSLPNYDPAGIPLIPGYIEVIEEGDPLAGTNNEHVGKVKLYTFRGPIAATGQDGVGWIRGENWWTFQRRTFVTPPFPGYYSGHSTYSRAAAEILTEITGSEYYPGGVGEFVAPQTVYLPHSPGPSVTTTLQWAKYSDAADQCSLSRIYGGLHPPQDDIPGRKVGQIVGPSAYNKAITYMSGIPHLTGLTSNIDVITDADVDAEVLITAEFSLEMDMTSTPELEFLQAAAVNSSLTFVSGQWIDATHYQFTYTANDANVSVPMAAAKVLNTLGSNGNGIFPSYANLFEIDTQNPQIEVAEYNEGVVTDADVASGISIEIQFDEEMDSDSEIVVSFPAEDAASSLQHNAANSYWMDATTYVATFDVVDANVTLADVDVQFAGASDLNGNEVVAYVYLDAVDVDTENPTVSSTDASSAFVNVQQIGSSFSISATYTEAMDSQSTPTLTFTPNSPEASLAAGSASWINATTYQWTYTIVNSGDEIENIEVSVSDALDANGNLQIASIGSDVFSIDLIAPNVELVGVNDLILSDEDASASELIVTVVFDDEMNTTEIPQITFGQNVSGTLTPDNDASLWEDEFTYVAVYTIDDNNEEIDGISVAVISANDAGGNNITSSETLDGNITIDTKNPLVVALSPSIATITEGEIGLPFTLTAIYSEAMDITVQPVISFPVEDPSTALTFTGGNWLNNTTYVATYSVNDVDVFAQNIDVSLEGAKDEVGNIQTGSANANKFSIALTIGIEENNNFAAAILYPNPVVSGRDITIAMEQIPNDLNVAIIDLNGKIVRNQTVNAAGNKLINVSTAGIAAGNYFIRLVSAEGNASFQVAITN